MLGLQTDDRVEENGTGSSSPLTVYAARHTGREALFLRKAMEILFDVDKPYFAAWLQSHDTDTRHAPAPAPTPFSYCACDCRVTPSRVAGISVGSNPILDHCILLRLPERPVGSRIDYSLVISRAAWTLKVISGAGIQSFPRPFS